MKIETAIALLLETGFTTHMRAAKHGRWDSELVVTWPALGAVAVLFVDDNMVPAWEVDALLANVGMLAVP